MKDMCPIAVNFDAGLFVCFWVAITSDMRPFIKNKHRFPQIIRDPFRNDTAKKPGPYY